MQLEKFENIGLACPIQEVFYPLTVTKIGFIPFEDIDKPENKFNRVRLMIEASAFIFGFTSEERRIMHELINTDKVHLKYEKRSAVENLFSAGDFEGEKCEISLRLLKFIISKGENEGQRDKSIERLCEGYISRVKKEGREKYLRFLTRFFPTYYNLFYTSVYRM